MPDPIRPKDLNPGTPNNAAALIFDSGTQVLRATPLDLVDAARPLASQSDAESGSDNIKIVSPLRVKQAISAQIKTPLSGSNGVSLVGGAVSGVQPVTDKFIPNLDGGTVNRIGDRFFAGGANKNDGNYPNDNPANQDWFTQVERTFGRSNGIIVSSQSAILTNNSPGAAVALTLAARSSTLGALSGGSIGLGFHVVNDNTVNPKPAWGAYSEAHRLSEACGQIINLELDPINLGDYHPIGPVNQNGKMTVGIQLANGGEPGLDSGSTVVNDSSAALAVRNNGAKWGVGVVFGYNAIRGTDGATGTGNAMLLGPRQRITWTDLNDAEMASVQSTLVDPASKTRLVFSDLGAIILGPTDNTVFVVRPTANAASYIAVRGGTTSENGPVLEAVGGDNADLRISTPGLGLIKYTNPNHLVATGSQAMSLGSTGPAFADPTPAKWLTFRGPDNTQYLLPAFKVNP